MKNIIAITSLLAAGTALANAATTVLETDFTSVSEMPEGWTSGQWNGWNTPHFSFSEEKGAYIAQDWKQNSLETVVDIQSGNAYSISFSTYVSDGAENGLMFYLSSDSYSIVFGTSYNSNSYISIGYLNEAVDTRTSNGDTGSFVSFQTNTGKNPTVLKSSADDFFETDIKKSLDYTVSIEGGALSISVSNGTSVWNSGQVSIAEDFSFDSIGFILDGGSNNVGVKNIVISSVPEPSAFGLLAGAGALALAAARRRRRKA